MESRTRNRSVYESTLCAPHEYKKRPERDEELFMSLILSQSIPQEEALYVLEVLREVDESITFCNH